MRAQFEAHAYDINLRTRTAGRLDLPSLVTPHEIVLPPDLGASPSAVAPAMAPFLVAEDDRVRVSAILVEHAPVFPSFAFRFDSDDGSIVISGDTAPCSNLVALARGADVLVHEVFDDAATSADHDEGWEARQRRRHLLGSHTPAGAVGGVAAAAEVGRLVLTHFVPGDDALPDEHWLVAVGDPFTGEVIVGADGLELGL